MNALSRLLVTPTLATALLLVCGPTNAAHRVGVSPYDGTWSVAIYTRRGDCGSVRVAAQIVGGRVYSKDQSYQANGAVGANGVIRVSVASGRLSASGSGRLSQSSGAGQWRSSTGECSGSWSASRRAAITDESGGPSRAPPHEPTSIDLKESSRSHPVFLLRPLARAGDFAAASLSFLPGIGSSISRCPSIRFLPFFDWARVALESFAPAAFKLCRSASIRFTTLVRAGSFGRSIFSPFCFLRSSSFSAFS